MEEQIQQAINNVQAIGNLHECMTSPALTRLTSITVDVLSAVLSERCVWKQDERDSWETECGSSFYLTDGTLSDNGMSYCCFCGKRIEEKEE